jgi:hypothetical protein
MSMPPAADAISVPIDLTPREYLALIEAVNVAVYETRQYLSNSNPRVDYGDEWPDVAKNHAKDFRGMASAMRKFGQPGVASSCESVAMDFEEYAAPGLCVTCGTQCKFDEDGASVICPKCYGRTQGPYRIGMEPTGGGQ